MKRKKVYPTIKEQEERAERRHKWWVCRWQAVRLWLWSVGAIAVMTFIPDITNGIRGVQILWPTWTELLIAGGVALGGILLDEELSAAREKVIKSKAIWFRKRKHAVIVGFGALGMIEKLFGGG